jgi:hypothetical protein
LGPARTSLTSSDSKQRRTRKFCDQQGIKVNSILSFHFTLGLEGLDS